MRMGPLGMPSPDPLSNSMAVLWLSHKTIWFWHVTIRNMDKRKKKWNTICEAFSPLLLLIARWSSYSNAQNFDSPFIISEHFLGSSLWTPAKKKSHSSTVLQCGTASIFLTGRLKANTTYWNSALNDAEHDPHFSTERLFSPPKLWCWGMQMAVMSGGWILGKFINSPFVC